MTRYDEGIMLQGLAICSRLVRSGCSAAALIDPQWIPVGRWRRIALAIIGGAAALAAIEAECRAEADLLREFEALNHGIAHASIIYEDFMEQGDALRRRARADLLIARAADGSMDAEALLAALQQVPIECGEHDALAELAEHWSVPRDSLAAFGVGWRDEAWVFPVRDRDDRLLGVMATNGADEWPIGSPKGAARPLVLTCSGPLILADRLIDAVAAHAMGLDAVRLLPNGSAGVAPLARGRDVVVLVHADSTRDWITRAGVKAGKSRTLLRAYGVAATLADWYGEGARRDDVLDLIRAIRGW